MQDTATTCKYSIPGLESRRPESGENFTVRTREQAIQYLMSKMKNNKKYSETDLNEKNMQKRSALMNILGGKQPTLQLQPQCHSRS